MRITPYRSREIFGNPRPPVEVREQQFDGFDDELREIGKKDWQDVTEADLWYYIHDLAFEELQPDLFAHLFPVCLNFWYNTLMRNEDAERGIDFHYALLHGRILDRMVTPTQREAIYQFMHDGFMDRVEGERGFVYCGSATPAYGWIYRLNALGQVAPIIERICDSWWLLDHPGKAVSALMWASGLVYCKGENPIFGVWAGDKGGGGPYLAENGSTIYDRGWLDTNLDFLRHRLSPEYIQSKLAEAANALHGEPEHKVALQIAHDAMIRGDTMQSRIASLLEGLAVPGLNQFEVW